MALPRHAARRRAGMRGAVIVEFAVAFMPLALVFFTFVQLGQVYTASLVLRHAAIQGVRTAAVVLPPNPGNVGKPEDVDRAVHLSLGPWDKRFTILEVKKTPARAPYELVTIEVKATYHCSVPLGQRIACGADSLLELNPIVVQYPNQGARYVQ